MRVRLLGPVDVMADGEPRPVSGLRRKAVLATLALHDGEVVSTGRLVDVVWGEAAPPTALNTLQSHVSHLRGVLGRKAAILARPPGYLLDLGERGHRRAAGRAAVAAGHAVRRPRRGARDLREALALWRGTAAGRRGRAGLAGGAGRTAGPALRAGQAGLFEARLAAGEHAQLVPDLEQMVADHPLDEQIHAQLMVALYRCGRQADALAAYQRLRRTLDEELGIEPSQSLRDLETAILRQDPSLDAPAPAVACGYRAGRADSGAAAAGGGGLRRPRRGAGRAWTRSCPGRPRTAPRSVAVVVSRRSRARPEWARPRWPCTGRTGWPRSSPTGSCIRTCAGSTRRAGAGAWPGAAGVPGRVRGAAGTDPCQPGRPGRRCTAACSRASGCWWCWTTRGTPSRCAAAARLARMPGDGDQPRPPRRPGGRGRRPPGWAWTCSPPAGARELLSRRLGADRVGR